MSQEEAAKVQVTKGKWGVRQLGPCNPVGGRGVLCTPLILQDWGGEHSLGRALWARRIE